MNKPMISVLLPVWRGADCIDETVQSIVAQTFTDWEMFIMGEPDSDAAVKDISRAYASEHERIFYIENDVRLGLAATLNRGIELARGKYIARVDVDDPSYPRRFEKQVEYMEAHDDVAICGTQQHDVFPTSTTVTTHPIETRDICAGMLFGCCIGHSTLFLRRELFIRNNWRYPTVRVQEDFALWLRLAGEAKFANLEEVLVTRRTGMPDNLTSIHAEKRAESSVNILSEFYCKYFKIDLGVYSTSRFVCRYGHIQKRVNLDIFPVWIVESLEIFQTMEENNTVFSASALSRTLRKQWNWMLETYGCFDPLVKLYDIDLPHLPVAYAGGFTDAMRATLQVGTAETADALRRGAERFVRFVKSEAMREKRKAVVFGTGFYCNDFFDKVPNRNEYFDLVAFCDNDKNKIGQSMRGRPILAPRELPAADFDRVLIGSRDYYSEIHDQLIELGIAPEKILPLELFRLRAENR